MWWLTAVVFPAIVMPTMPTALERPTVRDPQEMTPAELRCLREDLWMTVRDLGRALDVTRHTVTRWESDRYPISTENAGKLRRLIEFTDQSVENLRDEGVDPIRTYEQDADVRAGEEPGGWVLPASWYRMVAWRAAGRTGARVRYRED